MKDSYLMKFGVGLVAVLFLVILEVIFGVITGANALIPLGFDPAIQVLGVMGMLTVFMTLVFLYVKKTYIKK
jgi:hypothetical protein